MTNQPDNPPPDPTAGAPISGQPWSTTSGDALSEKPQAYQPPAYAPGQAPIPEPASPPTSQFPAQPPPVNYAPPGYAPDYGAYGPPPGYPPQGYPPPGYAPPPPPRKSSAPIIAVILAVTLLLCGGIATAGVLISRSITEKAEKAKETATAPFDNLPTEVPNLPGLPTDLPTEATGRTISVTYEVSGDGPVSIIYLQKLGDAPVRLAQVDLPWKFSTTVQTPALLSVVAVRLGATDGTVKCRALVDGDEVKTNTSGRSAFATTTCTHLALS
ncbi:MmpS family transport accessory protein [Actinoplanes subtropicus]|uniref:MmpS family transport accessory protein n=1 Tax=Actinoplanes subtropicus TaxID=543632 RepID=UPI0004C41312|nr:MmpS family transport accessory protein [Actinoplanes subtropicus]